MTISGDFILALLSSGIAGSIVTYLLYRRKTNAEAGGMETSAAAQQVTSAMSLMTSYKQEYEAMRESNRKLEDDVINLQQRILLMNDNFQKSMEEMRAANSKLRADNEDLSERVKRLEAQVISLGGHPVTQRGRKGDIDPNDPDLSRR